MVTQARYNLSTGIIDSTVSGAGITDPNQITALTAANYGLITVPDGAGPQSGMVIDGVYVVFNTPQISIPNITIQLVAALINNGTVLISAFHQTTIAQINASLSAAGLATIKVT